MLTESEIERELVAAANGETVEEGQRVERRADIGIGDDDGVENEVTKPTLERPMVATAASEEETSWGSTDASSFMNKQLCERWLDNLFMVLYEVRRFARTGDLAHCALGSARVDHLSRRGGPFSKCSTSHTARQAWSG